MRLKKLIEEYKETAKIDDEYTDIYVNPTSDEIDKASKKPFTNKEADRVLRIYKRQKENANYVRYIADDKTKRLYVFHPSILHGPMQRHLGLRYGPDVLSGIATKIGGVWTTTENHYLEETIQQLWESDKEYFSKLTKKLLTQWKWVDAYIITSPYIKNIIEKETRK
jgi:hypothetical protein